MTNLSPVFDILPQLLVNAAISGSLYCLAAVSLALSYRVLRALNFAHGHLMMLTAYLFYLCFSLGELSMPISIVLAGCAAVLITVTAAELLVIPLVRFHPLLPFVATLALGSIIEAGVMLGFGVNVHSLSNAIAPSYEIHGVYITPTQCVIIGSSLFVVVCLGILTACTAWGRAVRALGEHPQAAEQLGVHRRWVSRSVMAVVALIAGMAGVLSAFDTNLFPTMGNAFTIKAFAAMVVGGLGSVNGAVFGSYLVSLVEELAIGLGGQDFSIPAGYRDAVAFLFILVVLLVRPQGILGSKSRTV